MRIEDLPEPFQKQARAAIGRREGDFRDRVASEMRKGVKQVPARASHPDGDRLNGLEAQYAIRLEDMKRNGEIVEYWIHPGALRLGTTRRRYEPDFLVQFKDRLEYHETKGFMREDAREKIRDAAREYWTIKFVLVRQVRGAWKFEEVKP